MAAHDPTERRSWWANTWWGRRNDALAAILFDVTYASHAVFLGRKSRTASSARYRIDR